MSHGGDLAALQLEPEAGRAAGLAAPLMSAEYGVTSRSRVRRHPERASYDREIVHAILDEGLICHLGFVSEGSPVVIPTMYARSGEVIYLHGAPASRMLTTLSAGVDVSLAVTLLDGLVLARSVFHHSMNYRSVVVQGRASEVTEPDEKMLAFRALVDHVAAGRWADARIPSAKELGATKVLRLPLAEVSAKVRSGGPKDDPGDLASDVWAGEIPLAVTPRWPVPASDLIAGPEVPVYAAVYRRPGGTR